MGKKVIDGDYAKPLFTRLYKDERTMLDELVASYPPIPKKQHRGDGSATREITDTEVVRIAIRELHKRRCIKKKKRK